jgi:hypothetical protein
MNSDKYTTSIDFGRVLHGWKIRLLMLILMSLTGFQYSYAKDCGTHEWIQCPAGCDVGYNYWPEEQDCPECNGDCGYMWQETCNVCDGYGGKYVTAGGITSWKDCDYCELGYAWNFYMCSRCNASGHVTVEVEYPCPDCNHIGGWLSECGDPDCMFYNDWRPSAYNSNVSLFSIVKNNTGYSNACHQSAFKLADRSFFNKKRNIKNYIQNSFCVKPNKIPPLIALQFRNRAVTRQEPTNSPAATIDSL